MPWLLRAAERQRHAWAPGTINNYNSAVRKYLRFCYNGGIVPTDPQHHELCAYIEFLAHDTPSPKTVSNNLSHLRTYLRKSQASTAQADNCRVKWALYALSLDKSYIPRIKVAFPITTLQQMLRALPTSVHGNIIKVAVLLMFYGALWQSEVMPHSSNAYDPSQHLSRADVNLKDGTLVVCEICKKPPNRIPKQVAGSPALT